MPKKLALSNKIPEEKELLYRKNLFKDVKDVLITRLNCTCCLQDVKCEFVDRNKVYIHPLLEVLICRECRKFYGDGVFSADEDGSEKYCRWCGQGGTLYLCSECPISICKQCLTRNLPRSVRHSVKNDDWRCFVCNPVPIYDLRASAWALNEVKQLQKSKKKHNHENKEKSNCEGHLESARNGIGDCVKEIQKHCRSLDRILYNLKKKVDVGSSGELTKLVESLFTSIHNSTTNITTAEERFKKNWTTLEYNLLNFSESDIGKNSSVNGENVSRVTEKVSDKHKNNVKIEHLNDEGDSISLIDDNCLPVKDNTDGYDQVLSISDSSNKSDDSTAIVKSSLNVSCSFNNEETLVPEILSNILTLDRSPAGVSQIMTNDIPVNENNSELDTSNETIEYNEESNSEAEIPDKGSETNEKTDEPNDQSENRVGKKQSEDANSDKQEINYEKQENINSKKQNVNAEKQEKINSKKQEKANSEKQEVNTEKQELNTEELEANTEKQEKVNSEKEKINSEKKKINSEKKKVNAQKQEKVNLNKQEKANSEKQEVNNEKQEFNTEEQEANTEKQEKINSEKEEINSEKQKINAEKQEKVNSKKQEKANSEKQEFNTEEQETNIEKQVKVNSENEEINTEKQEKVNSEKEEINTEKQEKVNSENEEINTEKQVQRPFLRVKKVEELNSLFSLNSNKPVGSSIEPQENLVASNECNVINLEESPLKAKNDLTTSKSHSKKPNSGTIKSGIDSTQTLNTNEVNTSVKEKIKNKSNSAVQSSDVNDISKDECNKAEEYKKEKNSSPQKLVKDDSSSNDSSSSSISPDSGSEMEKKRKVKRKKPSTPRNAKAVKQSAVSKTKSLKIYDSSSSDEEIKKLMNLKGLDKKRKRGKRTSSDEIETEDNLGVKKPSTKKSKKKEEASLLDSFDSDDSVDLLDEIKTTLSRTPIVIVEEGNMEYNEQEAILLSSDEVNRSSNDGSDLSISDLDSDKKKKKSKSLDKSEKSDAVKQEKLDDSNDSQSNQKKNSWKNDKLLRYKLDDDSDSSDTFKKKTQKKKTGKSKIKLLSDSEAENSSGKKVDKFTDSLSSQSEEEKSTKSKKRKRIQVVNSSDENSEADQKESPTKGHRKNIRKILKSDSQKEATLSAQKEEQERKKRIAEKQKLYNQLMQEAELMQDKVDQLVLEFDIETKKPVLSVDQDLVKKLKPHQAEGIKFMWESCFESIKKAKKGKGSGCILAHCMGLGKTLQVVSLVHTLVTQDVLPIKTVLVLCPLSTVLNWVNEFEKWLSDVGSGEDVDVFHFTKVAAAYRANQLKEWQRQGGVFIMGYNLYRTLVNPTKRVKASVRTTFLETLTDPGPDLVICDEGHILKNETTALSKSVSKLKSSRRIVLTGTPLQNNLIEYHCMVQFVKPNLLGTKKEFTNRFVNPIANGQFVDSTAHDVKIMKRRAHVLHKMLDGIVQRKDYNVLVPFLPPKFEYVLNLSMSQVQIDLYKYYIENIARKNDTGTMGATLFKDRNLLNLICAHPRLIKKHSENALLKKEEEELYDDEEGSLKDFIDDEDSSASSTTSSSSDSDDTSSGASISSNSNKKTPQRSTRNKPMEEEDERTAEETTNAEEHWWSNIVGEDHLDDIKVSTKLWLFFILLQKCEEIGDKILLFSQSLMSLDLIEFFLEQIDCLSSQENPPPQLLGFSGNWIKGLDYFRLDGKSTSEQRTACCNQFNNANNVRARLFLISTRAGGMGINLTGANRVIIFDASWNPSHDVQSIFRIYRFGQPKPCYVYRFLSKGTMEQKVYDRQVTKLSMACRVVDEQQIDRHFSFADLNELYNFTPNEKEDETPQLPKDRLLADILQEHKDLILSYHTHDSLLENQANEELNEEERQAAWAEYENEKTAPPAANNYLDIFNKAYATLQLQHPTWAEDELKKGASLLMSKVAVQQQIYQNNQMTLQQQQMQQQQMQQQQLQQQQLLQQQLIQQSGRMSVQERHQQYVLFMQQQALRSQQNLRPQSITLQGAPRQLQMQRTYKPITLNPRPPWVPPQNNQVINPFALGNQNLLPNPYATSRPGTSSNDQIETVNLDDTF